ncbi:MAG: HAD hydrolase-like protein [Pseudomonadota bacterium]|nr:HAD hydrolase-like protein [Pseudomonadota bacterium]
MVNKNLDVLIFDWDDTLIEAGPIICKSQFSACKNMLAKSSEYPFTEKWQQPSINILKKYIRMRFLDSIIPEIFPEINYKNKSHYIWAEKLYNEFVNDYKQRPKNLFPHVLDTLIKLKNSGYTLTIATNKSREIFEYEFSVTIANKNLFSEIICGNDSIIKGNFKPKPDMLNIIQHKFPNADSFTMIGDSEFDMQAAATTNRKTFKIAIADNHKEFIQKPDHKFSSVAEIDISFLDNLCNSIS